MELHNSGGIAVAIGSRPNAFPLRPLRRPRHWAHWGNRVCHDLHDIAKDMKRTTNSEPSNRQTATTRGQRNKQPPMLDIAVGPLPRQNLVQAVVERLRELILSGAFQDDGMLPPEGKLGKAMGVSRTVVR